MTCLTCPPLAIVQARIGSTRLPGKMLLDLGGHPLVWWAWKASVEAFGAESVVCALPASAENDELAGVIEGFGGFALRCPGPESDVLGRFHYVAHLCRWHPDSVIVRVTADDPFKGSYMMQWVAAGGRMSAEQGGEAFTLAMLDDAQSRCDNPVHREHITFAIHGTLPTPPPPGVWTIDTQADLDAARAWLANR